MARRFVAAAAAALIIVAGCTDSGTNLSNGGGSGHNGENADPSGDGTEPSPRATTTTEAPRLEQHPADIALPVSFTAGDVVFEFTKAEFSNASPGTYLDVEHDLMADELLYVSFTARRDPALVANATADVWNASSFVIVMADGRLSAASAVDYLPIIAFGDAASTSATVVFPVTAKDLVGAGLRLDDGVNPIVEVSLTSATPAPPS